MCARQQGDMCSPNARCDEAKELHCQKDGDNHTGICKCEQQLENKVLRSVFTCTAQVQNPCLVDGVLYKDGEQFQPDCARTCTCQNGFYGCVTKCPQESKPPSSAACLNPQLLPVVGKCCKEWTCLKMEASEAGGSLLDGTRGLESEALILQRPLWCE
ncbi:hypothetical protein C0Q70_17811 [Pomacea canaliculata]|uniref:VWFC domain-containing protein n=1 Tax=Pomacea canaliculata TaxID=400727 RepID=A0A2T7NLG4_POMCA|nr:hypothetical protein C0Q70_17811 [Pomacea canaliculata]